MTASDKTGDRAALRILELELRPVNGRYDIAHLKEIHQRIFQDFPALNLGDRAMQPGQFRQPVKGGHDWYKNRVLESVSASLYVAYSPMDSQSISSLENMLSKVEPETLKNLKTTDFVRFVADLYANVDYIHPFNDGNSRILRTFTRQLADACGFELDWGRFNKSPNGRDILYVARDISVNRLALPHIRDDAIKRDVTFTLDRLEGNRDLSSLLGDAIVPKRAIAFDTLEKGEALKGYPELSSAYGMLRMAEKYFANRNLGRSERTKAVSAVRTRILERLKAGDIQIIDIKPEKER